MGSVNYSAFPCLLQKTSLFRWFTWWCQPPEPSLGEMADCLCSSVCCFPQGLKVKDVSLLSQCQQLNKMYSVFFFSNLSSCKENTFSFLLSFLQPHQQCFRLLYSYCIVIMLGSVKEHGGIYQTPGELFIQGLFGSVKFVSKACCLLQHKLKSVQLKPSAQLS